MSRTTVDVDLDALEAARIQLGTKGLSSTVNGALREVARRRELASFDILRDVDGIPTEVESNRRDRDGDAEREA
jgi:Arc/MetJ family transcription regulator